MLALGGLVVAATQVSLPLMAYVSSLGAAGFLGLLAGDVTGGVATVLLMVTITARLLTALFALLPATGRWCRRD